MSSDQILILAPRGRDAVLAIQLLAQSELVAQPCETIEELIAAIPETGCAIITAEMLDDPARAALVKALAAQPPWSDFPIILFPPRGTERVPDALAIAAELGNITILERPVQGHTLVSAVVAALRGRRRQYDAREAIERRDQFLAMLGHELRNPLAVIVLAIDSLQDAVGDRCEKQCSMIERQTKHLARLVDDLLDVARVTSGRVTLRREPVDLAEVIERCVQGAELKARGRGIAIVLAIAERPIVVDGDVVRLEEIFSNLLTNAIKYSTDGAPIEVRVVRDRDTCIIDVEDHGVGIAPESIGSVFELFAQVAPAIDRSSGGLGIGLTIVRGLVELHGGCVAARSAGLGHGATFQVRLPVTPAPIAEAPAPGADEPAQQRVLLVDDNLDLLDMTRMLLETLGCNVDTASDGADGLAQLVAAPPDIAFIDIGLPLLDGLEIARRARREVGQAPYLVAMTGYGQAEDRRRALDAGFDAHLTKPVTVEEIQRALAASRG